ncbi:metal-dependent hydrolase [Roseibium polysiphoniae]|uniref:Metal-dependent hydrolase n=1 Tax=Roseibium polysiphoniae TaxID=2571221 RepID=A0ABR9CFV0_9HYPH|nr:metal-dependent hydrolase [Roseibium polysiphoniae]MBD8877940.1 metal-dependent hydrolase [Roseibium polysiphoniae]
MGDVHKDIIPRDIHFGISKAAQRHWFDNDLQKTAIIDCFSVALPEGERFFIRSLTHYASKLSDKELTAEIKGYSVQEAFHTREHLDYNNSLKALGYDVDKMEANLCATLKTIKSPMIRLAVTCAIEHFTAVFSFAVLRHPEVFEGADIRYRRLWTWHALEELEHMAVAIDVFKDASRDMPAWKRYFLRTGAINGVAVTFLINYLRNVGLYARADGEKTGIRFWTRFWWLLIVKPGFARFSLLAFLKYYLPGYDPAKERDEKLIDKWREWVDRETSDLIAKPKTAPAPELAPAN